jgi:hypothetical protein
VLAENGAQQVEPAPQREPGKIRERTSVWPIDSNWQDKQPEQQQ